MSKPPYIAIYECRQCRCIFNRTFKRWPFLRNFWRGCPKCKKDKWPDVVREIGTWKVVQVR